jgi:hypothetical protein
MVGAFERTPRSYLWRRAPNARVVRFLNFIIMVRIHENKLIIEIETATPQEDLWLLNRSLLQLLLDNHEDYNDPFDPKISVYYFLQDIALTDVQLAKGI